MSGNIIILSDSSTILYKDTVGLADEGEEEGGGGGGGGGIVKIF